MANKQKKFEMQNLRQYEILTHSLSQEISLMSPGEKLPPIRTIMDKYAVSQATIDKAFSLLIKSGKIERLPGKGMYVADCPKKSFYIEICFFFNEETLSYNLYREVVSKMLAYAHDKNIFTNFFLHPDLGTTAEFRKRVLRSRPDALIFLCATKITFEQAMRQLEIPVISIFPNAFDDHSKIIRINNHESVNVALHHLAQLGHTRVAMLHGIGYNGSYMLDQEERLDAYYSISSELGLEVSPGNVRYGGFDAKTAYTAASEIFKKPNYPTAIICNDYNAEGVYQAIYQAGLQPGRDVAVVGFDDIAMETALEPKLTTVSIGWKNIAKIVVDRTYDLLENPITANGGWTETMDAHLSPNGSTVWQDKILTK